MATPERLQPKNRQPDSKERKSKLDEEELAIFKKQLG
jgi:hypothetical protein